MQPERAELYFQQGSSDKVYQLQLENVQKRWRDNVRLRAGFFRFGSKGTKTETIAPQ